jgi:hypothetical protein
MFGDARDIAHICEPVQANEPQALSLKVSSLRARGQYQSGGPMLWYVQELSQ